MSSSAWFGLLVAALGLGGGGRACGLALSSSLVSLGRVHFFSAGTTKEHPGSPCEQTAHGSEQKTQGMDVQATGSLSIAQDRLAEASSSVCAGACLKWWASPLFCLPAAHWCGRPLFTQPMLGGEVRGPGLDLNGVVASSWAGFVSISSCCRGGLATKRGKAKAKRKRETPFRFSPAR
eukprot:6857746-Pyramimonas_sp.AAC.1